MSRTCSVCSHPNRDEIDTAVAANRGSIRGIARQHRVSPDALERHAARHLPQTLARAVEVIPTLFVPRPGQDSEAPTLSLVVHPQRGVAPLLAEALRQAGQPAVAFRDAPSALAFVEDLVRMDKGFNPANRCSLSRLEPGAADTVSPRVEADCSLEWISLKDKRGGRAS